MAKEFMYRGKNLEELQAMSLEQFSELINSRSRRTLKKGIDPSLMKRINRALEVKKAGKFPKPIRTHKRDTIIVPFMVGLQFAIHKGNGFEIVQIAPEMLGHYFGELALTRKRVSHGKAGIGATKSSTAISAR